MKQQRRHELQTNELADQLGHYLEDVKPYTNHILIGVLAVAALVVVLLWWNSSQATTRGASWNDYFEAAATRETTALEEVTKLHPGTQAAVWAHLSAGDMQFAEGSGLMFRDRDEAKDALKEAKEHYQAALESGAAKYPWLVERAQFGLGQVYETQSELDKAIRAYQAAAAIDADSVLGKAARDRAQLLADSKTEGWYNWFDRQEPPTPGDMPGGSGLGPDLPGNLDSLPDRPDLSFPGSDLPTSSLDLTPGELPADGDSDTDMELTPPDTSEGTEPESVPETPAPETPAVETTTEEDADAEPAPTAPADDAPEAPESTADSEQPTPPAAVEESN